MLWLKISILDIWELEVILTQFDPLLVPRIIDAHILVDLFGIKSTKIKQYFFFLSS